MCVSIINFCHRAFKFYFWIFWKSELFTIINKSSRAFKFGIPCQSIPKLSNCVDEHFYCSVFIIVLNIFLYWFLCSFLFIIDILNYFCMLRQNNLIKISELLCVEFWKTINICVWNVLCICCCHHDATQMQEIGMSTGQC